MCTFAYCMYQSHFWVAVVCTASRAMPCLSCNMNFHYLIWRILSLAHSLSQMHPFHVISSYFFKIHFKLSSLLRLSLPSVLSPSIFQQNLSFYTVLSMLHDPPSHLPRINHPNFILRTTQIMKVVVLQVSLSPVLPASKFQVLSPVTCSHTSSVRIFAEPRIRRIRKTAKKRLNDLWLPRAGILRSVEW